MKKEEALKEFRKCYPDITSADIQTFILGYNAGNEDKESFASQARSEEREKQRKPLASVIIKPTCIETHGGENEAFEAAAEELRKRYILWALGEKPRQFTFEMYVDEYLKQQQ